MSRGSCGRKSRLTSVVDVIAVLRDDRAGGGGVAFHAEGLGELLAVHGEYDAIHSGGGRPTGGAALTAESTGGGHIRRAGAAALRRRRGCSSGRSGLRCLSRR